MTGGTYPCDSGTPRHQHLHGSSTQAPVCTQYFVRSLGRRQDTQGTGTAQAQAVATILASVILGWLKHAETQTIGDHQTAAW